MATLTQSTVRVRSFYMVDSGLTVSVALSKNGGAFAAAAGAVAEVSDGWYKISLTTVDTATLGDLAFLCTASGADPVAFVDEVVAAVGSFPTANQNADAMLDRTNGVETDWTPRQALRVILAALVGKLSGAATEAVSIRDVGDTANRIVATVDADGNRTAVVYVKD